MQDFPIEENGLIAGRYQIVAYLGAGTFSKAVHCVDLRDGGDVCIKIIKNNKNFFDQSLDEIKLLKFLNVQDLAQKCNVIRLYDFFYFKEHLFIVCELMHENLYEFSKFSKESGGEYYFGLPRIKKVAKQVLIAPRQ